MTQHQLHTGEWVDAASEAWRHETEAATILAMPTRERRIAHLDKIQALRGEAERRRLEETIIKLWRARRAA